MQGATGLLLIHFFAAGFQMLINQEAARRQCDRLYYTYIVAATTCALLLIPMLFWAWDRPGLRYEMDLEQLGRYAAYALFFLVLGGGYAIVTYARLYAQRDLPTYIFSPLSRLSLLVVVLLSVIYLKEERSSLELIAIALAFVPLMIFSREGVSVSNRTLKVYAIVWTLLSAIGAAGLQISSKLLVDPEFGIHMHVLVLVFGVNAGNMMVTAFMRGFVKQPFRRPRNTLHLGLAAGAVNVFSFMSLAIYLVNGDASTIYPISSLSMMLPVIVLMVLRRERRPTLAQWFAFLLSTAALIVLVRG